ncbi:MAG TPA: DmsC/YnfH family molybdoenzyme membrane anchor subunit [Mesorhizobium sp.]|jgi:DMSO reductase anchor subunit|nr:DmsC/YnfH family molybdoenzyme membrane anchor subunit [Mesorhizobium sp.]
MHPASSIIVFSTLSGAGYGLAALLGVGLLDAAAPATKAAHLTALLLIAAGLVSSTLHLGNPRRAWRAVSQWRSSWLSREGVLAVLAFVPLVGVALFAWLEGRHPPVLGLLGAALALGVVYCTGMIYASLRAVDAWATPLTPLCYLLFALSSGALLAAAFRPSSTGLLALALLALGAAWAAKLVWRRRMFGVTPLSSPESATGLGELGRVRLFEPPHMTDNYLTREMGFRIARKHAAKLWRLALLGGGIVPAALLLLALIAPRPVLAGVVAALAAGLHLLGLLVERWLFFAEARHAVSNYYGR